MSRARLELWNRRLASAVVLLAPLVAWRLLAPAVGSEPSSKDGRVRWIDGRAFSTREPARWNGRNPFVRSAGTDVSEAEVSASPVHPPYRPALRLQAIVGGPPWAAVLNGVPGRDRPVVVSVGEVLDSLTILHIDASLVRIAGPDTTWYLRLDQGRQ